MKRILLLSALLWFSLGAFAQGMLNLNMKHSDPRPDSEIQQIVSELKANSFPRQRLEMLKKATASSSLGFTGAQTVTILEAFETSTEKGEAIKIMDEYILGMDSENVKEAIGTAMFSSHKLTILDALRSTITDDDRRYSILDAFSTQVDKAKAKAILDRIEAPRSFIYGTIISKRVAFVVDISGSMTAEFRLSNGTVVNRMDFVRNEFNKAVSILPADRKINVFLFNGGIMPWQSRLASATAEAKGNAISYVRNCNVEGATNIYGSLKAAFEDSDVETIYYLTDGVPTAGDVQDPDGIVNMVRQWNQGRNVKIHTVAFVIGEFSGDNKPQSKYIMRRLAEATGGVYRAFE